MSENTVYNYADTSTRLAKVIQDLRFVLVNKV